MSIIFGVRAADDYSVEEQFLADLASATRPYATGPTVSRTSSNVGMGFQPYDTHERSTLEPQPTIDTHANILTFDGRLDNYEELQTALGLSHDASDERIVLAAFEHWKEECFGRLVGDWALALWCQTDHALYLARDHAGTRTLYYEITPRLILWSTHLESFFVETRQRALDKTYTARYLACQPARDLTPYKGIESVPPAHYLRFRDGKLLRRGHWAWFAKGEIRYQKDSEYDEHFLLLFRQAIERRTKPGAQILAQLSGGMDSTSIVCMSDYIRRQCGATPDELLDTVSFYDDSESSLDDRRHFGLVEKYRGKTGLHLESSFTNRTYLPCAATKISYLFPGPDSSSVEKEKRLLEQLESKDYRVLLSGIGGDELLGGVPSPLPELADYWAAGSFRTALRRTVEWCLPDRSPLFQLVGDSVLFTLRCYWNPQPKSTTLPPWLTAEAVTLCTHQRLAERDIQHAPRYIPPSHIANGRTWWQVMETLPHKAPDHFSRREYRYPLLDRDLVDYLLRVPQTQLLQPGRRRLMMRRALKGIVPDAILERRRKGFCSRGPLVSLSRVAEQPDRLRSLLISQTGLVNSTKLAEQLADTCRRADAQWSRCLMRALSLEAFLLSHMGQAISV